MIQIFLSLLSLCTVDPLFFAHKRDTTTTFLTTAYFKKSCKLRKLHFSFPLSNKKTLLNIKSMYHLLRNAENCFNYFSCEHRFLKLSVIVSAPVICVLIASFIFSRCLQANIPWVCAHWMLLAFSHSHILFGLSL